jgi:hypothetical protein
MRHWSNKQFNTILKFESSSRESKILEVSPGQNILICYGSFNEFDVIESAETMLPQTINIQNKEMSSTPFWYSIQIPNTVTFIERNKILKVVSLDTQKEVINLDCGLFVTGALITSSNNMICLAGIDGLKILDSNYKIIYHHKLSDLIYAN